jgi:hypothetical protein
MKMVPTLIICECITVYFGLAPLARCVITSILRNKRLYLKKTSSKSVQRLLCTHHYQYDLRYGLFGMCLERNSGLIRQEGQV